MCILHKLHTFTIYSQWCGKPLIIWPNIPRVCTNLHRFSRSKSTPIKYSLNWPKEHKTEHCEMAKHLNTVVTWTVLECALSQLRIIIILNHSYSKKHLRNSLFYRGHRDDDDDFGQQPASQVNLTENLHSTTISLNLPLNKHLHSLHSAAMMAAH